MTEWFGWAGTVLCMIGIYLIGQKRRVGFLVEIASCTLWAIRGYATDQLDLITVEVLLIVTQLHAWTQWGKDVRPDNQSDHRDPPRSVSEQ